MTGYVIAVFSTVFIVCSAASSTEGKAGDQSWISLSDGKTFNGWRASENRNTFTIEDGAFVAAGPRSHLYYEGPVEDANFTDFELKVDVMTRPGSNGGIIFHTEKMIVNQAPNIIDNSKKQRQLEEGLYDSFSGYPIIADRPELTNEPS